MPKPRSYQTEAIIIKKIKLGEADRILTLYTPHLGKIRAVAKGVRRPRSKMAGHLELLTHSQITLARGRNLETVIGSQTINGFLNLKSDLDLTSCALYAAELVDQFMPDEIENQPLFQLFLETLGRLSTSGDNERVLRYFEMHLLSESGYRPQLHECVACHTALTPVINAFCPDLGGMLCPECQHTRSLTRPISVNALKVLRLLQSSSYDTAGKLRMDEELANEVEWTLRHYIRHLLEREVKSTAWMDTLRRQANSKTL